MAVPKLRFREFADEWQLLKASDIFESVNEKNFPNETVLTIIQGKGTLPRSESGRTIQFDENTTGGYKKVELNDFIIHLRSFEGGLEIANSRGIVSPAYTILRNKIDIAPYFYRNYFRSKRFIEKSLYIAVEGIRDGRQISYQQFSKILLQYTSFPEQQKIADFLSLLDRKIALQEKKIALLKDYKKGVENIINKSIENSKLVPLSEMLIEVSEKSKTLNEYPIISSTVQGLFWQSDYFNREIASKDNIGYKILKKNQIVLSPQNLWMGNINYNSTMEIGLVSPSYKIFEVNKKFYAPFIGFIMKSDKAFFEYKLSSEQGASIVRRNLNIELFYEITFNVPSYEKQIEIISMLNSFDKKLNAESKLLTSMQHLKQALLQRMFI